jgi:hypothetical protein
MDKHFIRIVLITRISKGHHLCVVETNTYPYENDRHAGGSVATGRAKLVEQVEAEGRSEVCPGQV